MEVLYNNKPLEFHNTQFHSREELEEALNKCFGWTSQEFYLVSNGRKVITNELFGKVHVVLRLCGGKGGFGSMLRAIGAQIEKTTNREACRDLSGRRLRDINEEQRLKKWVEQQAEREKEAKEKKQKKLEKLLEEPKFEFKDELYDKERADLPEKVEEAVLKGLEASCSTKRKSNENDSNIPKKKKKLWLDDDLDDLSSDEDSEEDSNDKPSGATLKQYAQTIPSDEVNKGPPNESKLQENDLASTIIKEKVATN